MIGGDECVTEASAARWPDSHDSAARSPLSEAVHNFEQQQSQRSQHTDLHSLRRRAKDELDRLEAERESALQEELNRENDAIRAAQARHSALRAAASAAIHQYVCDSKLLRTIGSPHRQHPPALLYRAEKMQRKPLGARRRVVRPLSLRRS